MTIAPDDDARTTAQGLFNYADSYLASAHTLLVAETDVVFPEPPVRALLYHGVELHLKAFLRCAGVSVGELRDYGHKFSRLLPAVRSRGLSLDHESREVLLFGQRTGDVMDARYIRTGYRRWYPTAQLGRCAAKVRQAVRVHPLRAAAGVILRGQATGVVDDGCERAWLADPA